MEFNKLIKYVEDNKSEYLKSVLNSMNKTCKECDGFGYTSLGEDDMDLCDECLGEGVVE